MGKLSRTKGHSFEREVAIMLKGMDPEAKRHLEYQVEECGGRDIDTKLPLCIQCKSTAQVAIALKGLKQAEESAKEGEWPVCFANITPRKGNIAVMYLEDFLEIFQLLMNETGGKGC